MCLTPLYFKVLSPQTRWGEYILVTVSGGGCREKYQPCFSLYQVWCCTQNFMTVAGPHHLQPWESGSTQRYLAVAEDKGREEQWGRQPGHICLYGENSSAPETSHSAQWSESKSLSSVVASSIAALPSPRTTRCWCQPTETREHTELQRCLRAEHRYCWPRASPRVDSQSNPQPNWGSELQITKVLGGKPGSRRGSTHRGRRNLFSFPYSSKRPPPIILNASPPALSSETYWGQCLLFVQTQHDGEAFSLAYFP